MTLVVVAIVEVMCLAGPARQMLALNAARPYVERETAADIGPVAIPENIVTTAAYRVALTAILRVSPTFRRQCLRIARSAHLRVLLQRSIFPEVRSDGALTRILRTPQGGLEADVQIGVLGDQVLLVAHEFEHILEQLDEVDLPAMADRSGTGVRSIAGLGHFETDRAIAAGRRVAEEVSNARRRH
jgi:hypothetical protein